jgi:hypothetical protein
MGPIEMSPLRALTYFLWSSLGILLFVGAALAEADVEMSADETIDECLVAATATGLRPIL